MTATDILLNANFRMGRAMGEFHSRTSADIVIVEPSYILYFRDGEAIEVTSLNQLKQLCSVTPKQ
jgi:hypothetical protein